MSERSALTPGEERDGPGEGTDGPEPTESAPRLKRQGVTGDERATRVSVRPSAFGPPRPSSPPPEPPASSASVPQPPIADADDPTPAAGAGASEPPAQPHPSRPLTLDELTSDDPDQRDPLTNSQFATRLSQLPAPEPARSNQTGGSRARRPLLSIAVFAGMLSLSAVPLLRYLKLAEDTSDASPAGPGPDGDSSRQPLAAQLASSQDNEPSDPAVDDTSFEAKQQTLMALVAEANRALEAGDAPQAERLFGRVVALDEDNPRAAFGLSRIRLSQGNLSGAEGWVQLAIRKRPRRAAYHAHYAAILERLGNHDEAQEERRRAQGAQGASDADE